MLGQSPSHIIYDYKVEENQRPTRDNLYDNPQVLQLRTELIKRINSDVSDRM